MAGANLFRSNLEGAQMSGADLSGVTSGALKGVPILPANWNLVSGYLVGPNANLTNAQFTDADLYDSDLLDARLTGANLTAVVSGLVTGTPVLPGGWKLIDGYLVGPGAHLNDASLIGADLANVNLSAANLNGAQLTNASLVDANLSGTILANADVAGADFSGANLFNANVLDTNTDRARTNSATICPGGEKGPCSASWRFVKGQTA